MKQFTCAALAALVIAAGAAEAQTYRTTRQIRGAWHRPPASIASMETVLQNLALAGITDVFPETLYHGVTLGKQGVFNQRYPGNDYLGALIPLAAKYGMRVHAWCETGYLQFGTTGAYNFTVNGPGQSVGDPAWRAINISTGAGGGDGTAGQIFGNLAHPGLQQKLRNYFAELAGYTGLWGIQTDYHRYPLDNNTGDAFPAPWSYDTYSRTTFQSLFGSDPQLTARFPGDSQWNNFLAWRRAGITQAANQMHQGINSVNPSIDFSIAMFANPETTKCQDWQSMASNGYVEWLVCMAYGSTTTSITNDLNKTRNEGSGRRPVAGLYVDSFNGHPTIPNQLAAATTAQVRDWIFFSGVAFANATNRTDVRNYTLGTNNQKQRGDYDDDGYIDARDWVLFTTEYTGVSKPANARNARYNYDGDSDVDEADFTLFKREFARFRFGEDGIVDARDLAALQACFGHTTPVGYPSQHLYDLDGDGDVDYADQVRFHLLLTVTLPLDTDANRDGRVDIEDLYFINQSTTIDVNRDGAINAGDILSLERFLQAGG